MSHKDYKTGVTLGPAVRIGALKTVDDSCNTHLKTRPFRGNFFAPIRASFQVCLGSCKLTIAAEDMMNILTLSCYPTMIMFAVLFPKIVSRARFV